MPLTPARGRAACQGSEEPFNRCWAAGREFAWGPAEPGFPVGQPERTGTCWSDQATELEHSAVSSLQVNAVSSGTSRGTGIRDTSWLAEKPLRQPLPNADVCVASIVSNNNHCTCYSAFGVQGPLQDLLHTNLQGPMQNGNVSPLFKKY